jgi:hypothetical protein
MTILKYSFKFIKVMNSQENLLKSKVMYDNLKQSNETMRNYTQNH